MKMLELAQSLEAAKGKKVYGYLKKSVKAQVDAVVDEIAKLPEVAECYEVWNGLRDELEKGCVLPKLERKEMKILPPESLGTFFEEARRSGVFELYYIDLDLVKGIIHVRRQVLRQNGEVVEAPLKTKNSYRNIAIGADAIKVLKEMEQKDVYVFHSPFGGPMSPDSVLHMLQRVLKRAGLERIRFHDLRHTFSVLALQNGVDVKTLSAMLGHYSAGFTLDTYAHVTTSMQKQAANAVGNFLSGTLR